MNIESALRLLELLLADPVKTMSAIALLNQADFPGGSLV